MTFRVFGPKFRFDHHTPDRKDPAICPDGRSVLYVAKNLRCAVGEVFGDLPVAQICPNYRVAVVEPVEPIRLIDLNKPGGAMKITALPSLAYKHKRRITQAWSRAIWEDQPVRGGGIHGVRYRAAHSNDDAVALWNKDGGVQTTMSGSGLVDSALHDMKPRVRQAFREIGMAPPIWSDTCNCGTR